MFLNKKQIYSIGKQVQKAFGTPIWHKSFNGWIKGYGDLNQIKKSEGKQFVAKNWFVGERQPDAVVEDLF